MDIRVFLDPIEFGENPGFKATDLKRIRKLVTKHKDRLLAQWDDYHGIPKSEGHEEGRLSNGDYIAN